MPPLRERPEDVPFLLRRILTRYAHDLHRPVTGYTTHAMRMLLRYGWPGNIREMENAIEAACASATGTVIDVGHLPSAVRHRPSAVAEESTETLRAARRGYILRVLLLSQNNKRLAAQRLEIW